MDNNQSNYKSIEVKKRNKNSNNNYIIGVILFVICGGGLFFSGAMFLAYVLSGLSYGMTEAEKNGILTEAFVVFFISIISGIMAPMFSKKKTEEIETIMIAVDKNKKNKCINCNTEFDVELDVCPNCNCYGDHQIMCSSCGVYNNIHRTECVNCGGILSENFRRKNANLVFEKKEDPTIVQQIPEGKTRCMNCGQFFEKEKEVCPNCNFTSDVEYVCEKCNEINSITRLECSHCGNLLSFKNQIAAVEKKIKPYRSAMIISFAAGILTLSYITDEKRVREPIHYIIGGIVIALSIIVGVFAYKKYQKYNLIKNKIIINNRNLKNAK